MARLTKTQKREIVEELACFETPTDVAETISARHGIDVDRQQVANYDASKPWARKRMASDLADLFDELRRQFREETDGIAIANKAWRLRQLERGARRLIALGNHLGAAQLLEQGAKEAGGKYTNKQLMDVTSGGEKLPVTGLDFGTSAEGKDEDS